MSSMIEALHVVRKITRYTAQDDIHLLRLVLEINPFTDSKSNKLWEEVAEKLSTITKKELTSRSVKERTNLLLNQYNKNCTEHLRRSTTDEQFDEKIRLLTQVTKLLPLRDKGNTSLQHLDMGKNLKDEIPVYDLVDDDDDDDDDNYVPEPPKPGLIITKEVPFLPKDTTIKLQASTIVKSATTTAPSTSISTTNKYTEAKEVLGRDKLVTPIKEPTAVKKRPVKRPNVPLKGKTDVKSQIELRKLALEEKKVEIELRKQKLEEARFKSDRDDREMKTKAEIEEKEMKTKAEIEDKERRREFELKERQIKLDAEVELKKRKMLICDRIIEFIEHVNF